MSQQRLDTYTRKTALTLCRPLRHPARDPLHPLCLPLLIFSHPFSFLSSLIVRTCNFTHENSLGTRVADLASTWIK